MEQARKRAPSWAASRMWSSTLRVALAPGKCAQPRRGQQAHGVGGEMDFTSQSMAAAAKRKRRARHSVVTQATRPQQQANLFLCASWLITAPGGDQDVGAVGLRVQQAGMVLAPIEVRCRAPSSLLRRVAQQDARSASAASLLAVSYRATGAWYQHGLPAHSTVPKPRVSPPGRPGVWGEGNHGAGAGNRPKLVAPTTTSSPARCSHML